MRCQCCNAIMLPHEGKWDEAKKEFEPLCNKCLSKVFEVVEAEEDVIDLLEVEYNDTLFD